MRGRRRRSRGRRRGCRGDRRAPRLRRADRPRGRRSRARAARGRPARRRAVRRGAGRRVGRRRDRRARCAPRRRDAVLNACDPRFNPPIFEAALDAGVHLPRHGDDALRPPEGTLLGQDAARRRTSSGVSAGVLALVGIGVEPGLSDVFARYAADQLFSEIDEVGVRDGADLVVDGYDFAPTFSIWTTIEECLNPPLDLGARPRLVHDRAVLRARGVRLPRGDRPDRVRQRRARGGRAHPALGRVQPRDVQVRPRRGVHRRAQDAAQARPRHARSRSRCAASRSRRATSSPPRCPNPAELGDRMRGRTCAGTYVTGTGKDGQPRRTYLYHVVDNEQAMRDYGHQAVVLQTAFNPVVALELLDAGAWTGVGVLGPEAFAAVAVPRPARRLRRAAPASASASRGRSRLRPRGSRRAIPRRRAPRRSPPSRRPSASPSPSLSARPRRGDREAPEATPPRGRPRRRCCSAYARIARSSAPEPFDQPANAHLSAEAFDVTCASIGEPGEERGDRRRRPRRRDRGEARAGRR